MEALQAYDWPGNVRELENVVARAMIHSSGGTLELDAPLERSSLPPAAFPAPPAPESAETLDAVQRRHIERVLRECGWRINGAGNAAVRLGVHPNTLRFRIKKLGVMRPARGRGPEPATAPSGAHSG
jgi:DNA-binding NtrC family response regulator